MNRIYTSNAIQIEYEFCNFQAQPVFSSLFSFLYSDGDGFGSIDETYRVCISCLFVGFFGVFTCVAHSICDFFDSLAALQRRRVRISSTNNSRLFRR